MEIFFRRYKIVIYIVCFFVFVLIFLEKCSKDQDKESVKDNEYIRAKTSSIIVNKETERFIALEDSFAGEYIYLPVKMEQHPITKEILVLDQGNHCIYFFDERGKYLKKIGDAGQGPGDLLKPLNMQIDVNEDILVCEEGNTRISIFDRQGKFLRSFRIFPTYYQSRSKFAITPEYKIFFNIPYRKHYVTIFDREGNAEDFGNIRIFDIRNSELMSEQINIDFARGKPFIDNDGNYVLFLSHLPVVLVFDKNGEKISEKNLENVLEITKYRTPDQGGYTNLYFDIIKSEDHYFFVKWVKVDKNNKDTIDIMKLDMEFNFIDKYHFIFDEELVFKPTELPNICIVNDGKDLLFAIPGESEILKFSIKE